MLPLLHQLRHGKESRVLRSLAALVQSAKENHPRSVDIITNTEDYFRRHENHIHYAALDEAGAPVGSGAVESQCSQFQGRFKCTGPFWSDQGFANITGTRLASQKRRASMPMGCLTAQNQRCARATEIQCFAIYKSHKKV